MNLTTTPISLAADWGVFCMFATEAEALAHARKLKLDSFEIRNEVTDLQLYVEWPQIQWV